MALIYFYDATELDKQQLSAGLLGTDHHWEYVSESIALSNCNPDTEVISVFVPSHVTREIIEALPRLKLIACRATGFDAIDLQAAKEHDITVVNVPAYGEATVAEYAFTLLLALQRKLPDILTAHHDFSLERLRGHDLEGKVLGVIGTGHIGKNVLRIANGFSMKLLAYDAYPQPALQAPYNFSYVDLEDLLSQADIVTLHTPYLPSTHHFMNRARLASMKPGAILVNTARGELVDTEALVELLSDGHLGGAALDVVEGEALLRTATPSSDIDPHHETNLSVLQKMPNVILSPHNAFNTVEAIGRINHTTAQNIIDFWYGKIPNKVEPPEQPFGKLLVARHAESEWNATGQWTGITDVHLSDKGFKESVKLGHALKKLNIPLAITYCSQQIRTRETLEGMLDASGQFDVDIVVTPAFNERDYGDYTGKNKWEMKELIGEEAFNAIRRGWDVPVPGGETLKTVYERAIPFYLQTILPLLKSGKNVLIVAHGNTIRALMKYLEKISDEDISKLEMPFGRIDIYNVAPDGHCISSSTVNIDTSPPNA